jgi:hypothetical protein
VKCSTSLDNQQNQLIYADRPAAKYMTGGWLEEYVYNTAQTCGFKHVGLNVKGDWADDKKTGISNEFDVVIVYRGKSL